MPGQLDGKVAIVTGSSRGIGKAIAKGFAKEGAKVVVCGRTSSAEPGALSVEGTVQEIEQEGGQALAVACDVTSESDVNAMVERALREWSQVDVLVNNAGILWRRGLLETTSDKWNEIIRTNLDGPYYCSMAVLPGMMERRSGSIIGITSGRAYSEDGESTAYAATKAGLDRLTVKLATELREHGIAVNALEPGATLTERLLDFNPQMDVTGWQRAEEKKIIPACVYLASLSGNEFTGRIVNQAEFGTTWP